MEKKATRRIIGVLVAVALVIILLPLMFNGSDNQSNLQASEVKAPPFPGSDVQTTQSANMNNVNNRVSPERSGAAVNNFADSNNSSVVSQETLEPVTQSQNSEGVSAGLKTANLNSQGDINAPIAKASNLVDGDAENIVVIDSENDGLQPQTITKNEVLADLNKSNAAAPSAAPAAEQPGKPVPTPTVAAPVASAANNNISPSVQAIKKPVITAHVTPAKKPAVASVKKVAPKNPPKTVAATTETVNLKKPAWMVQLGSFKNKINAERLTNNLRAKGYKAFTLQGKGSSVTRVCVGPEFQQTKAATLAGKIAQDTNLRGIVMSYKPLEL